MENSLRERADAALWQGAEQDWQATAERLQRCVSLLLLKNQRLRMELLEARSGKQKERELIASPKIDSP